MKQLVKDLRFGLLQSPAVGIAALMLSSITARADLAQFSFTEDSGQFHDFIYWLPFSTEYNTYAVPGTSWSRTLSVTQIGPVDSTLWRFAWSVQHLSSPADASPEQVLSGTLDFDTISSRSFATSFSVSNERGIDNFSFGGFREDSPSTYYLELRTEHIQPVPEPATLALWSAGLCVALLGSGLKNRSSRR